MNTKFLRKSKTVLSVFLAVLMYSCAYAGSVITTGTTLRVESGGYFINQNNLTVNSGGTVHIYGNMTVTGTFINSAETSGVVIKSDAESTGSLLVNSFSGNSITAERYLTHDRWHYISEPLNVSGNFNSLNLGLTPGTANDQFYRWNESLEWGGSVGIWVDILNGPDGNNPLMGTEGFVPAKGYAINYVTNDKILSLNGVPYTSSQNINITKTPNSTFESWNQVGNPFCSNLAGNNPAQAANNFITANSTQLDDSFAAVYLWNEQASYVGNRNDYINFSNSGDAKYIEVGQAFMVKSKTGGGTITFNPNIRKHGTATFYKNTMQGEVSRFYMSASNDDGLYNEILIAFMDGMTKGLDKTYDVGKLKGNPDIALYSKLVEDNGVDFAHQALPPLDGANEEVKIGLDVSTPGTYLFKIEELENFDETISIKLEDKQQGNMIDFREAGEYVFTLNEPGQLHSRFVLHFNATVGIEEQMQDDNLSFYVYNNTLYIVDEDLKDGVVQFYNLLGQPVMEKRFHDRASTIDLDLPAAYYIVRIITQKNAISRKIYLK